MNEVDRLYNEWREKQRIRAEHTRRYCKDVYQKWCVLPEYIKASVVLETSKALNEFLEKNKNNLCDDEIKMRIKYAEEELERRANTYSELTAQFRNKKPETRGNLTETLAYQNQINSASMAETKTISTEGKNTMEKTVNVNTKIDIATLIQAKMAEKMMDAVGDGKDIPLTKLTIMQSLANGGSIDVTELIRVKQTEKLLKDLNENKDLSIGKLLTYQALTSEGGFDVNALIQAQFVEKLFAEDEKTK